MTRLHTSRAARADIRDIGAYSKTAFGVIAAREYLTGLSAIFDLLESRPMAGPEDRVMAGMRSFRHRPHRIYYQLDGDTLLVLRILHHARDAAGALEPDQ